MISVQPLRDFEQQIRDYGEQARNHDDTVGATRLRELADRAAALANELEAALSRLGNPATDRERP